MILEELNDNSDGQATAVFYGAGTLYRECAEQLHQLFDIFTALIVDQKYTNTSDIYINGIPCRGPEVLSRLSRSTLIVICTRNHLSIANDLETKGFINIKYAQFELSSIRVKRILDYPKKENTLGSHKMAFGDRTALVTGSTRGIGLEIAVALAFRGVRVILHGRTESSLRQGLQCFEDRTASKTDGVVADLSYHNAPNIICQYLLSKNIHIDILYNNAGISPPTFNGTPKEYGNCFDPCMMVNFTAVVGLTSLLLPKMLERNYGRIVFLTSMAKRQPDLIAYICSKAAITSFASEIAHFTQDTGLRVSTLDPGWVRSDMGGEFATRDIDSVIPGALVGALTLPIENGIWVSAQDYAGLSDGQLIHKLYIDGFLKEDGIQ